MKRLTHKRNNGIKIGYWSPNTKEEVVQCLAEYENLDLTPEQLKEVDALYTEAAKELGEAKKRLENIVTCSGCAYCAYDKEKNLYTCTNEAGLSGIVDKDDFCSCGRRALCDLGEK